MTFFRRQLIGWSVLLVAAALGGAWMLRLDYAAKISTDVLDLVPADQRDPDLAVVRSLASEAEAKTMLFVIKTRSGESVPVAAATRFAAELMHTGAFTQAIALGDSSWRDAVGHELFRLRMTLLFPFWLNAQRFDPAAGTSEAALREQASAIAQRLKQFVASPEGLAFQDLVPADPLLLLPDAIGRLRSALSLVEAGGPAEIAAGLVWARLKESPLSEAGQAPVFAAIERAASVVRAEFSAGQVEYTGVNRFAAASRARIEREVTWLNTLSLVAVLAVALAFIRQPWRALHLVPVIVLGVLGAWVATTLVFDRVHVLVFVLGAMLTGVAIDYGFYLFMQPPSFPDETYWSKVRRLAKPLVASCLTTVVGFALLLWSDLPLIRHLGLFVGAGLLGALATAIVYFSTVENCFLPARGTRNTATSSDRGRRRTQLVLLIGWIASVAGLARVTWRDDIRELEVPAKEVQADDARIRAAFGQNMNRTVYLTRGPSLDAARDSLEGLQSWLGERGTTFANLAPVIPTRLEHEHALKFARRHADFGPALSAALEREGFSAEEFEPFTEAYSKFTDGEMTWEAAVRALQAKLAGPLGMLIHLGREQSWFVTLAANQPSEPPGDLNTVTVSQLQSLNRLFGTYRTSALKLSASGLLLIGIGVFLTYGWRDGVRIFAIPCGACLAIFGLFGWFGQPLNLFHLIGAFLGVCLTHNYSIFSATSAYRREPPPVSVRLSALTTAASFGVLALSGIPVVRALGITVAAMVVAALLAIELEHLRPLGKDA